MKTIFRYTNIAVLVAVFTLLGAVASFAQDPTPKPAGPCEDTAGISSLDAKFRDNYAGDTAARAAAKAANKIYDIALDLPQRKMALDAGKQYLEKYGACPGSKEFADYLTTYIPKMEKRIKDDEDTIRFRKILQKFDDGLKAKNWDDVYSAGKQVLAEKPDDFRAVELVLGSVGYDEMFAGNNKWTDETLTYAKQSLADLQAGKEFKPGFGVKPFTYKTKEDAAGWMNLTIGSIYQIGKKDKASALPYLYAATQATGSDVAKNPNAFDFIGSYYFDQVNKLVEQIKTRSGGRVTAL